jgi:diketogulonate reductase-like aldo/keto reductase
VPETPTTTLRNGVEMPLLGFGVFQIADPAVCEQCVVDALTVGYRLLDTAASYRNEEAVGRGIARSGVPREELFVTTKVWVPDVNYEGVKRACERSLNKLGLDQLDLLLFHQPYNDVHGGWRAMQELLSEGKVRAIGVSNFDAGRLTDFVLTTALAPMVNQIETHPFNQQAAAREIMDEYGIQHEGWAPFAEGRNDLFGNAVLAEIGAAHGKSVGQVVLRWNLQRGVVAIPKSVHRARIEENFDILDFELTDGDMQKIAALDEQAALFVNHDDPKFIKMLYARDAGNQPSR